MNRSFVFRPLRLKALATLVALLFLGSGNVRPILAASNESDGEVDAREVAMELAGSFSNDGYKIRDGHWSARLLPGDPPQLVQVNLYAGNQYYFSLGATDKAKKLSVVVYDETGKQVEGEQFYQEGHRAAAGVSTVASGSYYVGVQLLEGDPCDFCLVCSYK